MNWVDIPYSQFSYKKMPATSGVYRFYSTIDNTELYVGKLQNVRMQQMRRSIQVSRYNGQTALKCPVICGQSHAKIC